MSVYRNWYEFPVQMCYLVLEVSHSGYYAFLGRRQESIRQVNLIDRIREIHGGQGSRTVSVASSTSAVRPYGNRQAEEVEHDIADYIKMFCYGKHLHSSAGYLSPNAYEKLIANLV